MTTETRNVNSARLLKSATCKSLAGSTTVGYEIGVQGESDLAFRLASSTGGGFFSTDWVPLATVLKVLKRSTDGNRVTAKSLRAVYPGKSVNSAGFLLAALLNEGAVNAGPDRRYELADLDAWILRLQTLLQAAPLIDTAVKPAPKPKQVTSKTKPATKKASTPKPVDQD